MDCLFCKIIKGEIPSKMVHQDERLVVIEDINPQSPHHVLIMPRKHVATLNDLTLEDNELIGHMVQTAKKLAADYNVANEGYRLVLNCNPGAGQTVFHIHMHFLAGRQLTWPPG